MTESRQPTPFNLKKYLESQKEKQSKAREFRAWLEQREKEEQQEADKELLRLDVQEKLAQSQHDQGALDSIAREKEQVQCIKLLSERQLELIGIASAQHGVLVQQLDILQGHQEILQDQRDIQQHQKKLLRSLHCESIIMIIMTAVIIGLTVLLVVKEIAHKMG